MKFFAVLTIALALMAGATASPGAHGPNGEHLDGPAAAGPAGSVPRVETFSEMFELVGQLSGGEFSVMIDRYETNEPVLNGTLEVEYKGMKSVAKYHADMGDYAIDDPKLVKALSAPGKHALLFTFAAGQDSDLLEGTLEVGADSAEPHEHTSYLRWAGVAIAVLAALAILTVVRRRTRRAVP